MRHGDGKSNRFLDFDLVPRAFGNPRQHLITSKQEYYDIVGANMGRAVCYTSHNAYPSIENTRPLRPNSIHISKLSFDFDCSDKMENALLDVIKCREFFDKCDFDNVVVFSGGKGFHIHLSVKPKIYKYNAELRRHYKAFYNWLERALELRTLDPKVKTPTKLFKIPGTPYFSKSGKSNGLWCCALDRDMVSRSDMNEIVEFAKDPCIEDVLFAKKPIYHFHELFQLFGINVEKWANIHDNNICFNGEGWTPVKVASNEYEKYLTCMFPRPCFANLWSKNPDHVIRVNFVLRCRNTHGMGKEEIRSFYAEMSDIFEYVDRHNTVKRDEQINAIYPNTDMNEYGCNAIRQNTKTCVGESCPWFNKGWSKKTDVLP